MLAAAALVPEADLVAARRAAMWPGVDWRRAPAVPVLTDASNVDALVAELAAVAAAPSCTKCVGLRGAAEVVAALARLAVPSVVVVCRPGRGDKWAAAWLAAQRAGQACAMPAILTHPGPAEAVLASSTGAAWLQDAAAVFVLDLGRGGSAAAEAPGLVPNSLQPRRVLELAGLPDPACAAAWPRCCAVTPFAAGKSEWANAVWSGGARVMGPLAASECGALFAMLRLGAAAAASNPAAAVVVVLARAAARAAALPLRDHFAPGVDVWVMEPREAATGGLAACVSQWGVVLVSAAVGAEAVAEVWAAAGAAWGAHACVVVMFPRVSAVQDGVAAIHAAPARGPLQVATTALDAKVDDGLGFARRVFGEGCEAPQGPTAWRLPAAATGSASKRTSRRGKHAAWLLSLLSHAAAEGSA